MQGAIFGLNQQLVKGLRSIFLCRWLLASVVVIPFVAAGQNYRCRLIPVNQPIKLDSIVIETGSVSVEAPYHYDDQSRVIRIADSAGTDSVEVCYRVLSPVLTQTFRQRDIKNYEASRRTDGAPPRQTIEAEKEELFQFDGINKYGAITRGVSFGNRQNVFVNSALNLQMDGEVADNLFVSAVITDQNVPYQPEGNTQQIRDFDNVFIKLYNDKFSATAGDIVLKNDLQKSYFLKYYKNVQGLELMYSGGNKWKHTTKVSGALSKGKFASTLLESIEGLSGPYKLRGPNGERFIIVLANTEKVYLDGTLMERGFDRDYIIDYNLGELTFNNHIVITQFSRIRVDFEYAEEYYSRSNFSIAQSVTNDKVNLYGGFYQERDNPDNNFGFVLGEGDIDQLQSIGDDVSQAFVSGFDTVAFDENRILYQQKDTVDADGNIQRIFQFSTDNTLELFAPTFSDVGEGNGDYVLLETTANGRIYQWISPQSNVRQGRYQPGAFIPLPNSRRMVNFGTEVKLNDYETVFSELALSNADLNLYSELSDQDNAGWAYYGGIRTTNRPSFLKNYQWTGSLSVEYDQQDFTFIDRYRSIEFDRNWDLTLDSVTNITDLIIFGKSQFTKNANNQIAGTVNHRRRGQLMEGWQQSVKVDQSFGDFVFKSNHQYLTSTQQTTEVFSSSWLQSKSDLRFQKYKIAPGYIFQLDENELSAEDSVLSTRMHFQKHEWYVMSGDSAKSTYRFSYNIRQDRLPQEGIIRDYLYTQNWNANYQHNGRKSNLSLDVNYRKLEDELELSDLQDQLINGRFKWRGSYLKKHFTQNLSFSTGNSRELRREFVYVPVSTGEGTHTWRDLNEDGVQDLNEFFEAINPDERNFVKIFTPTDQYITSFQTFYIHTIDLRSPIAWRKQKGLKAFMSNLSLNLNFNINYRTTSEQFNDRLNPFSINLDNTDLIAVQDTRRYTLFFNRNGRGFAGDFALLSSDNKQLLTQGFESREKNEWIANVKIDLSGDYTFRMTTSLGNTSNQSDFLTSRNFDIVADSYEPQLIWLPSQNVRIIGSYKITNKANELLETSKEKSLTQRYKAELTWNQLGKGSIRALFSWVKIDFEGDPGTYLGYLMLDALQPGTNQTWQLNWQQKLSRGMQLSLLYNGRKSEQTQPIHTGSVQVTAFF